MDAGSHGSRRSDGWKVALVVLVGLFMQVLYFRQANASDGRLPVLFAMGLFAMVLRSAQAFTLLGSAVTCRNAKLSRSFLHASLALSLVVTLCVVLDSVTSGALPNETTVQLKADQAIQVFVMLGCLSIESAV